MGRQTTRLVQKVFNQEICIYSTDCCFFEWSKRRFRIMLETNHIKSKIEMLGKSVECMTVCCDHYKKFTYTWRMNSTGTLNDIIIGMLSTLNCDFAVYIVLALWKKLVIYEQFFHNSIFLPIPIYRHLIMLLAQSYQRTKLDVELLISPIDCLLFVPM